MPPHERAQGCAPVNEQIVHVHVSRAEALEFLPPAYSLALRLRDAQLPNDLIAECLGLEPETIGPLLGLAEAKLTALMKG